MFKLYKGFFEITTSVVLNDGFRKTNITRVKATFPEELNTLKDVLMVLLRFQTEQLNVKGH